MADEETEDTALVPKEDQMPKAESASRQAVVKTRLVTIASSDNPNLLVSAPTYPQTTGSAVTFDLVRPNDALQPFAWWILNPVSTSREVYQILFFAHDGNMCLTAAAAAPNAALNLSPVTPGNLLQLWTLEANSGGGQTISCYGHSTEVGFPDIPLKGLALQLMGDLGTHHTPDTFLIDDVSL